MSFANDILDAIEIMVKQVVEDNATKIYTGVCKTTGVNNCVLTINGKDNTVKYYGGVPVVGTVYQVFIPFGNMSAAFIIVPGSGGESGGSGVDSVNGKTGDVTLNAADVGLGNVDNIKQYSASNPPPYPVISVNGKTGGVNLIASDVGAAPAGYGLGTFVADAPTNDDGKVSADLITKTGFYRAIVNIPFPGWNYVIHVQNYASSQALQIVFHASSYKLAFRLRMSGTWGDWEYINPSMTPGTEYKTAEMYNGKPVYAKSFNTGALPAGSGVSNRVKITSGISNADSIVDYRLVATDGSNFYMLPGRFVDDTFDCWVYGVNLNNGSPNFYICASKDMSTFTGVLTIKYTKSTD